MDFEVWTRADADILLSYIDVLIDSLYGLEEKSFGKVIERFPNESPAQLLVAEIKKTPENLRRDLLRKFKEDIKSYEVMKLTVAVALKREVIEEIVQELRKKVGRLVLDLEVRPEIIGGAKIYWRGRYWEKTLEQKYDEI